MVNLPFILPYAAWMVLMMVLPCTAWAYAARTALVAVLLMVLGWRWRGKFSVDIGDVLIGLAVGLAVFAIWILPEQFGWEWYRRFCIVGDWSAQPIEGWLFGVRLFGSACVIAVAEELFFRKWMIGFAGFWWSVALFAVEHDRWLVGAIAGAVYALVYLRKGLVTAIVAHAVTNLALGIWVITRGQWQFW